MIRITFSGEEVEALRHERFNHPHPRIQERIEALYLKSQGLSHGDICRICDITKKTFVDWLRLYIADGIDGLKRWNYSGKKNEFASFEDILRQSFKESPVRSVNEATQRIEKLTGIKRRPTQIRMLMRKLGLSYRKVGHIPGKAATKEKMTEQREFLENELEPRLNEAQKGKREVFFWMPLTSFTERS